MKLFANWLKSNGSDTEKATAEMGATFSATPAPEVEDGPPIGVGRKILIVDDNKIVLKAFEMKLKSLGFQVLTAADGSAAVSTARQERPDLVVLDVNFPPDVGSTGLQWDGFNIMEWMSRFKEVANIPVIIITSGDILKFKPRAMAAGAVAFFQKPINQEEFILAIRRILGNSKSSNPAAA